MCTGPAQPVIVEPEADTRLDQLAAEYAALKPLADEYAARLEAIKTGIKAELAERAPDAPVVLLRSTLLPFDLRMVTVTSWRLDTAKLKTQAPQWYAACARQSTTWRLEQAQ